MEDASEPMCAHQVGRREGGREGGRGGAGGRAGGWEEGGRECVGGWGELENSGGGSLRMEGEWEGGTVKGGE